MATTGKQLFTTLEADGTLTVAVEDVTFPEPTGNQVLVKMEAAPINPSDLAILVGAADMENASYAPGKFIAKMPEPFNSASKARHGLKLPAGNEGAGTVVAVGDGDAAKALMGQRVSCVPGNAYSQYCIADAAMCLPLGDHSAEDGASAFVNPMTALGFAENAKMDGQDAILHTVGASNLGQMLTRICLEDGIGLVNIVRKDSQAELLEKLGATHVVNSSKDDFPEQLRAAIDDTGRLLRLRPDRRWPLGRQCLQGDGGGCGKPDDRVFALWLEPAEAHVHLRAVGHRPDDPVSELRIRLDPFGMAPVAVPAIGRDRNRQPHASARA